MAAGTLSYGGKGAQSSLGRDADKSADASADASADKGRVSPASVSQNEKGPLIVSPEQRHAAKKRKMIRWTIAVVIAIAAVVAAITAPLVVSEHAREASGSPAPSTPASPHPRNRPNIVFILADDQDAQMNSLDYMPTVQELIADHGTTYTRHYCTVALCCPSRVSLWTGRAAHNTNVTDLSPPYGKS